MRRRVLFAPVLLLALFSLYPVKLTRAQAQLGRVTFPNSGAPAAQEPFLKGVAALHSFWYEEALEYFQAATKADPDFALGYWGETLTYTHPLWSQQAMEPATTRRRRSQFTLICCASGSKRMRACRNCVRRAPFWNRQKANHEQ